MSAKYDIEKAIITFLEGSSGIYTFFPTADSVAIPHPTERTFLKAIQASQPIDPSALASVRKTLNYNQSYDLVTFAVRMAIFAARTQSASIFTTGVLGLVVDEGGNNGVDPRDLLRALAIIEDCSNRIGRDFPATVLQIASLATDDRRSLIISYLARSSEMRTVDVMGFLAVEENEGIRYAKKPEW